MQADGYTLDDKRNKITGSDLPDIVQRYKNHLNQNLQDSRMNRIEKKNNPVHSTNSKSGKSSNAENPDSDRRGKHFTVPKKEIVTNSYDLNLSTYKEEVYEEVKYEKPKVIFGKLETIEENIQSGLEELKPMVQ